MVVTVDVEEWYHSCLVPEYVDPTRRPPVAEELDRLLPELLERFGELGLRATFFVLGEVAARLPGRIREVALAGHEVACHGYLHLRANDRAPASFRADVARAKSLLEDIVGGEVAGFRAPEWSLRTLANPRLRTIAELGFRYDSSLMPAIGAGSPENARDAARILWPDGMSLVELPPLVWAGPLRLPAGGWCGRCAPPSWVRRAIDPARCSVLVVHPWELTDRPVPGLFTGFARFFHDAGRRGYAERFARLVAGVPMTLLGSLAVEPAGEADPRMPETVPSFLRGAGFNPRTADAG